jgi:hypothetical protein
MFCDDFQTRANCEPQEWDEGILVPNAIHVVVACLPDQRSSSFRTPMKSFQNSGFYLLGGFYFVGRLGTLSSRVWSNVRANEPAAEPAESYFVDWSVLATFQSRSNCRQKDFVSDSEVLETLADTPRIPPGLPVELDAAESFCNRVGTPIGGVQFGDEAQRPLGPTGISFSGHLSGYHHLSGYQHGFSHVLSLYYSRVRAGYAHLVRTLAGTNLRTNCRRSRQSWSTEARQWHIDCCPYSMR